MVELLPVSPSIAQHFLLALEQPRVQSWPWQGSDTWPWDLGFRVAKAVLPGLRHSADGRGRRPAFGDGCLLSTAMLRVMSRAGCSVANWGEFRLPNAIHQHTSENLSLFFLFPPKTSFLGGRNQTKFHSIPTTNLDAFKVTFLEEKEEKAKKHSLEAGYSRTALPCGHLAKHHRLLGLLAAVPCSPLTHSTGFAVFSLSDGWLDDLSLLRNKIHKA